MHEVATGSNRGTRVPLQVVVRLLLRLLDLPFPYEYMNRTHGVIRTVGTRGEMEEERVCGHTLPSRDARVLVFIPWR